MGAKRKSYTEQYRRAAALRRPIPVERSRRPGRRKCGEGADAGATTPARRRRARSADVGAATASGNSSLVAVLNSVKPSIATTSTLPGTCRASLRALLPRRRRPGPRPRRVRNRARHRSRPRRHRDRGQRRPRPRRCLHRRAAHRRHAPAAAPLNLTAWPPWQLSALPALGPIESRPVPRRRETEP